MDVIPIVDGYRVSSGVSRAPVGGPQMRQKLQHYLLGKNYSLTTFLDSFVVRTAIESLAYMSRNFDRELGKFLFYFKEPCFSNLNVCMFLERYHKKPEKIDCILELSKSTKLEIGSERFESVEGLFKPELWGLDQAGVHVLVHKAIRECSMDVRKEITQSIFLAGGLSMIPGLRERMELELEKLSPATKPRYKYMNLHLPMLCGEPPPSHFFILLLFLLGFMRHLTDIMLLTLEPLFMQIQQLSNKPNSLETNGLEPVTDCHSHGI